MSGGAKPPILGAIPVSTLCDAGGLRSVLERGEEVEQRGIDFVGSLDGKPMAGTLEDYVASQVGRVLLNVGKGLREKHVHGIQASDHEVGRLHDLGAQEVTGQFDAAVDAAIPVDRTAEPVAVVLAVLVEILFGESARERIGVDQAVEHL